jgi:hypothetical protein
MPNDKGTIERKRRGRSPKMQVPPAAIVPGKGTAVGATNDNRVNNGAQIGEKPKGKVMEAVKPKRSRMESRRAESEKARP